jgi:antitoxin HicB
MNYHFKWKKESQGYSAVCVELPGCVTEADDFVDLHKNAEEALNLFLDEPPDSRTVFPFPKKRISESRLISVEVKPRIAFAFALRMFRMQKKLTQRELAARIGIEGALNNYQRLESSKTANPGLETLVKIKKAFPDFPLEVITG